MGRIRKGWDLTKKAWGVVRSNPGLMKLPVIGGLLGFLALLLFGVPGVVLISAEQASNVAYAAGGVLIAVGLYLSSFAVIYFNVALAAAADSAFRTGTADVSAGMATARSRIRVIAAWAAVAAIVSMAFNLLRQRGGLAGQIAAGLGAAIWALVTFLIAPVLAFEGLGPFAAIKRSSSMFKDKWGQQITGNIAIGAVTGIVAVLAILIAVAGGFVLASGSSAAVVAGGGLLLLGVVLFFAAVVVSGAVRGVFGVALYRYIADEQVVGPFSMEELESAVKVKGSKAQPAI
ncbi:MAG: hypothetical protein JHD02_05450 [Thermoleophilaceae bacterium]|nr:hypothetical protein [Thermoleophilaceae bacterium]